MIIYKIIIGMTLNSTAAGGDRGSNHWSSIHALLLTLAAKHC